MFLMLCPGYLYEDYVEIHMSLMYWKGGLETESDYSYTGHKQKCDFNSRKVAAYINSSVVVSKDEKGEKMSMENPT